MKILLITSPELPVPAFPEFKAWAIDLPFDFEVQVDPYGNIIPEGLTDEQKEIIDTMFAEAQQPTFVVNDCLPSWVTWGKERITAFGTEDAENLDDETIAVFYVSSILMTLAECSAIYCTTWF